MRSTLGQRLGQAEAFLNEAQKSLALGQSDRARRAFSSGLGILLPWLRENEPDLWKWMRFLAAVSGLDDRPAEDPMQMSLWSTMPGGEPEPGVPRLMAKQPLMITRDSSVLRTTEMLVGLAPTSLSVLIEGETGTGKEVLARLIHASSLRSEGPFVAVNCGAIPSELHESELFGHARGAFTGATGEKAGLFEVASGGTVFLDEVAEIEPKAQAKLLRVLELGEIRRIGETKTRKVDVRVIAATNVDVDAAVEEGRFRADLLFRLGAIRAWLPPLRHRKCDILPLAVHFARCASERAVPFTPGAERALLEYEWPGNVRELKFAVERAVALLKATGAPAITEEMLMLGHNGRRALRLRCSDTAVLKCVSDGSAGGEQEEQGGEYLPEAVPPGESLDGFLRRIEKRLIEAALVRANGNKSAAARMLGGISRTTLLGRMQRLGISGS